MFGIGTIRGRLGDTELKLEKLTVAVRELKAQRRDLLAEWLNMYEKFDNLYRRSAKRQRDADHKAQQSRQDAPGATNDDGPRVNPLAIALLTGRQR